MSSPVIKPWVETVELHPDVLSPDFSEDIFALDLGPLADGNRNVPSVYRDPELFFRASYLTVGLKSLLQDVLSRLSGGAGNRVLKLITPFGGGKSHTLASLFHAAGNRKTLDSIPEGKPLPKPGKVNTAVFDGQFFSPTNGKDLPGGKGKVHTMWGWVAWSLAGEAGYEIVRESDEARVSPGGDDIIKLLGNDANLILLDEVLEYLISAGGIKVHDTTLRDETLIRAAYPFHPALIDLMRERWAAIPDFQRTRGALRFLAACLRAAHTAGKSRAVLGPGDVPLQDQAVRLAFFKEVGQQPDFQACLEYDFVGANARTRRIDERRAKEFPAEALKRPATRIATAILMYSFGGLRREGANETEMLPPGISETDLLAICVGPDLDSTTAFACLKELKEQCLYLHFDGVRYCFKKDPNVTLLVEQEADTVARDEDLVRGTIKEMLEARLAGQNVYIWPTKSGEVPDREPSFTVAYLPLDFGADTKAEQQKIVRDILEKFGDKPRQFRNGLGLAVPSADQIEVLRRAVRYLLAIDRVKSRSKQHNLTDEQKGQLREREATEKAAAESAFLKLYTEVWLPKLDGSAIGIESVAVGGRPLQTTLNEKKEARIHERVMELLTQVQKRVFDTVTPGKMVEFFKLGEGTPAKLGVTTGEVVTGFYSFLGFTRLISEKGVAKAIATGVEKRLFGYIGGGVPALGEDGKYQVALAKVRFDTQVAEDEIDLESGFIMVPQAIPKPAPVPGGGGGSGGGTQPEPRPIPPEPTPQPGASQKSVEFTFTADSDKLFGAWSAMANLAEMAGQVTVTVKAEKADGFDKSKLTNGVLEPLREADLIQ